MKHFLGQGPLRLSQKGLTLYPSHYNVFMLLKIFILKKNHRCIYFMCMSLFACMYVCKSEGGVWFPATGVMCEPPCGC